MQQILAAGLQQVQNTSSNGLRVSSCFILTRITRLSLTVRKWWSIISYGTWHPGCPLKAERKPGLSMKYICSSVGFGKRGQKRDG